MYHTLAKEVVYEAKYLEGVHYPGELAPLPKSVIEEMPNAYDFEMANLVKDGFI